MIMKCFFFSVFVLLSLQSLTFAWPDIWSVTQTLIISLCVSPGRPKPTATSAEVKIKTPPHHRVCVCVCVYSPLLTLSGRAGRVSKGYCYRLVTKDFWKNDIPDYMIPEMLVKPCFVFFSFVSHFCPFHPEYISATLSSFPLSWLPWLLLCSK